MMKMFECIKIIVNGHYLLLKNNELHSLSIFNKGSIYKNKKVLKAAINIKSIYETCDSDM
jgi:hypothetical protein